ncbi:MAG: hypothetical protein LHW46_07925 [Candidatus Cloacimonetes bacterium]|jgi:membrane protein YdbS with pleckstrin-like domain|nr:hypothetical protein [Candidatus Cloacimonadota bacterium]MDY0337323.1 hypothetical protein [Candidatus Cloacimonadaceae bacterium]MCK9335164.1 hypothetical protein [Candidatus Cloacimonadota bacterium]MDD2543787.1 hypothetical protein [Candidatus Cloacimonadota bacterium]MDD2684376.1 hypothetical protein [Candidatus Cloacimonadota bacterium]
MSQKEQHRINLGPLNYLLLVIAAIILVLGYFVMSLNEITISPVLLLLAYVVIIPIALLIPGKKKD